MACREREYEMSLSLDGRLPSGRRAALVQHIGACATCSSRWQQMQRARELARSLPSHRPGMGFRDGLRRRIAAGEGASEVISDRPMSTATKARHLATGAVAATVLLTVVTTLGGEARPTAAPGDREDALAAREPRAPAETPAPASTDSFSLASSRTPPVPRGVPMEAALAFAGATRCARLLRELRARLPGRDDGELQDRWGDLSGSLQQLRTSVDVMRWLESNRIATLPQSVRAELLVADRHAARALMEKTWEGRRAALEELGRVQVDRLQNRLDIHCCRSPRQLMGNLSDLFARVPGAAGFLRELPTLDVVTSMHGLGEPVVPGANQLLLVIPASSR